MEDCPTALADTYLQYYLGIQHPERLSDEEWAFKLSALKHIRQKESENPGS